jgi:hypothetical protein
MARIGHLRPIVIYEPVATIFVIFLVIVVGLVGAFTLMWLAGIINRWFTDIGWF